MMRTALGIFLQMKNMGEQLQAPLPPPAPSSGIWTLCNVSTKKSNQHNPFKQDLSFFDNVVTQVVGTSPFNIDGNKIYQIKCDKYAWKEKLSNGRHWQVNWGKMVT